ncbi:MAG: hypothetical protein OEV37_03755 [Candidatus Berkelbacteria bacterium]|nr:hypothetical protein [Candidatus Berkelbacteria bacterium]
MTKEQKNLVEMIGKFARDGKNLIEAGPDLTDAFGRKLKLEGQAFDKNLLKLSDKTQKLLKELQKPNSEMETTLRGQVMWYDIRSSVWQENPELSALIAFAYAKVLIDRTGQTQGHTVNVAIDCYPKHFESMSWLVDALIRSGITQNNGGIIFWGVQNGGSIRNVSMLERAVTGKGGNWIYATMSHRSEDYVGAKFGLQGKVFVGPDLMEDMYGRLIKGDFPEIVKIDNPYGHVVTVGDLTRNNLSIAIDLIKARTGIDMPANKMLAGIEVGINVSGSPVGKNLFDLLSHLGASVTAENKELDPNFSTSNIIDPNEHESEPMEQLKRKAEKDRKIHLAVDPDGDRGTIIALNPDGKAESLAGTELLLLAMENLATYNPRNLPNDAIYDMRTGISAELLGRALRRNGFKMDLIAAEPGYPFFMEAMGKNKGAVIAVENTAHAFMTPMTNPIWGAPKYYSLVQGGDDAALFLIYLLAACKHLGEGRNPVEQLYHIREKYNIPKTIIREYKPVIDKKDALRKYDLARAMCKTAKEEIELSGKFLVDTMNSGVRITNKGETAMVLVRYSNTGPSFTASGEAVTEKESEYMFTLGAAVMNKAVNLVKKEKGDFDFDWNNFSEYADKPANEAQKIIDQAAG